MLSPPRNRGFRLCPRGALTSVPSEVLLVSPRRLRSCPFGGTEFILGETPLESSEGERPCTPKGVSSVSPRETG